MWPAPGDNTRLFRIILFQLVHVLVMSLRKDDVIIILIFVSFFPINHRWIDYADWLSFVDKKKLIIL